MEDEEDSVPVVETFKADHSSVTVNDAKSVPLEDNSIHSEEESEVKEETNTNIDRLKSAINHDADSRFKDDQNGSTDLSNTSPKKLNGELGKGEHYVSSEEESCCNEDKTVVESETNKESYEEEKEDVISDLKASNKRKRSSDHSDASIGSGNESDNGSDHVELKDVKKRKVLESEPVKLVNDKEVASKYVEVQNVVPEPEKPKPIELRRSTRNASISRKQHNEVVTNVERKQESGDQLTEYAQYLGLQPTVKFKCGRCGEKSFQSMATLNDHQLICCKTASNALAKQPKPPSDSNMSTNFRITRKVYLCSACGTYYENWKLFLHMRDMHKRHICLFCLGMFSVADRLAEHLLYQHNVHEKACKSPEEFLNLFKGSCYLTCCSCEKMFTERDDFYDHQCKDSPLTSASNWNDTVSLTQKDIKELAQKCNLCGVKCGHFRTCPKMAQKFQQNLQAPSFTASTNTPNNNASNTNLEKYYVPITTNVQKNWTQNNLNQDILKHALSVPNTEKDYYDVGNAASFCHVDIANDTDNRSSPDKATVDKAPNVDSRTCPTNDCRKNAIENLVKRETDEEQIDSSKSLPNNNHSSNSSIVNSVSDECSSNRLNLDDCEMEEEPNKTSVDNGDINKEDNNISAGDENVNMMSTDDVDSLERRDKKASEEDIIPMKQIDEKTVENESEELESSVTCSVKLDEVAAEVGDSVKEMEVEEKVVEEEPQLDYVPQKLDKLNGNISNSCDLNKDEDEEVEKEKESRSESNMSNTSSSSCSSRISIDDDNDDARDSSTPNELIADTDKMEDSSKKIEDESSSKNEEHVNNSLHNSSLNNESSLLNEKDSDNQFENDKGFTEDDESSCEDKADKVCDEEKSIDNRFENDKSMMDGTNEEESKDSDEFSENESVDLENDKDAESEEVDQSDKLNISVDNVNDDSYSCKDTNDNETEINDSMCEEMETNSLDRNCADDDNATMESHSMDIENDVTMEESQSVLPSKDNCFQYNDINIQLASEEVMAMALTLEDKMESLSSQSVIKECVRTSCTTCSYCSHAIKIAVNGRQLAIHLLTEHRYTPVKNETTEDIVERLKQSLDELKDVWFNTDSYDSFDKSCFLPYDHTYECFQCNYVANTHKDLSSHKRKVHQKTILYCSMCKENFYSYSELLCHMCVGLYDAAKDIQFRCCLCTTDRIPSAFRLMVHLRKIHHTCDICLEVVNDQQKLSVHMVKHKLHHLCYRCGIAYRNKPDITKHLFWKHGTESVLCKKCLQKKWPHVYHFCIPPNSFICEECNLSFSKAVYLKVHKRFHNNNLPYLCGTCEQKFVSKKLLAKHERTHESINNEDNITDNVQYKSTNIEKRLEQNKSESGEAQVAVPEESTCVIQRTDSTEKSDETSTKLHKKKNKRDKDKKVKPVVDVYDLPPLNLSSESDDTEDEKEARSAVVNNVEEKQDDSGKVDDVMSTSTLPENDEEVKSVEAEVNPVQQPHTTESGLENEESVQPVTVVDGIWDNFHTYKAEQEKRENLDIAKQSILSQLDPVVPVVSAKDSALGDHDYCLPSNTEENEGRLPENDTAPSKTKSNEHSSSIDHDYCTQKNSLQENNTNTSGSQLNTSNQSEYTAKSSSPKRKQKSPKKKMKHHSSSSSDSSSDSDSSSCSCGTNCSCSSSSSNSSSSSSSDSDSSSSDGQNNSSAMSINNKREKKKERLKSKKKGEMLKIVEPVADVTEPPVNVQVEPEEPLVKESDLDTDETITDEEFYDQYPQMQTNQILAEKRNQLMLLASVAPTVNNGAASPPVPSTNVNLDPIGSPKLEIVEPPGTPVVQTQSKKRVKAKKRRKSTLSSKSRNTSKQVAYDTPQPSTSFTAQWSGQSKKTVNTPPMYMQSPGQPTGATSVVNLKTPDQTLSPISGQSRSSHRSGASESNSSKRFSKRRRVRNKFYGYSSDEEGEQNNQLPYPSAKWKKFSSGDVNIKQQQFYPQQIQQSANTVHPEYNHSYQQPPQVAAPAPPKVVPIVRTTFDESQISNSLTLKRTTTPAPASSSSSSESEADSDSDTNRLAINHDASVTSITATAAGMMNVGTSEKDDKLYCYCQCPYDEVSEMIACDGVDCAIEWFHFECVGIMVPPKGKWYCPDCRKRRGLS